MKRASGRVALTGLLLTLTGLFSLTWHFAQPGGAGGQQPSGKASWIWFDEGDPAREAPKGTVYFRKVINLGGNGPAPVDEGVVDITADAEFSLWVNGALVGSGKDWKQAQTFDVKKFLVRGNNAIAVEVVNQSGKAGLLTRFSYIPNGQQKLAQYSDATWKASKVPAEGWQKNDFDDRNWRQARVLGPNGMAPWGVVKWGAGGDDRFTVPEGFRVEMAVRPPDNDKTFSLVNCCFDAKGRLLISRENGPILLCTAPDKDGVLQTVKTYCDAVKNCQGMCWIGDALWLVGNGPKGTGLYRCRDTKNADKIDEATLVHAFKGGMGEHGPHAVLQGPDGMIHIVVGNHAWPQIGAAIGKNGANPSELAKNSPLTRWPTGGMGPDQGKENTTEDVLLPRLNDARGHAVNILAPGGTIWRMDHEGKNMSLVTSGFRNAFDAAFAPNGELFSFDSDMEWDEDLPWYRPVRVVHCPPGADFVWRTGAANTPSYYIDSLPPIAETGRGSPVGLEFYDHVAYPKEYKGAYFMGDWAIGVIFAVHLERDGASYKTKVERFCQGAPMNVTDLCVGPDGALYFVMGGRNSQGGVYRIVYKDGKYRDETRPGPETLAGWPQPLAAWSQYNLEDWVTRGAGKRPNRNKEMGWAQFALDPTISAADRIRMTAALQQLGQKPTLDQLAPMLKDKDATLRAHAIWLIGVNGFDKAAPELVAALEDPDALVRRRSCEALIRIGAEPPVAKLWPLFGEKDRFVRNAARLVLERIDPKKWVQKVWTEPKSYQQINESQAWNGIVALCHTNQAPAYVEEIFGRLHGNQTSPSQGSLNYPINMLEWLRTVELAMVHCERRPIWTKNIAKQCDELFPHADWRVNRELAILLVEFQRGGQLDKPIQGRLLKAMANAKTDRLQQIYYAYCMRVLRDGWTPEAAKSITDWYEGTRPWTGGHSFLPFLENIYRDCTDGFEMPDKQSLLARAEAVPLAATALVKRLQVVPQPELLPALRDLAGRLKTAKDILGQNELTEAVNDAIARTVILAPTAETLNLAVDALASKNPVLRYEALMALRKSALKPKADDAARFRALLAALPNFGKEKESWEAILLLRQWTGRNFGALTSKQWQREYDQWALWFNQNFPKETPLKSAIALAPTESKYKFDDLLNYVNKDSGDAARGRVVFEKATCIKCHKYGKEGEGVGPDLTTLSKRFKRVDVLESIVYPSKVISDQYRSVKVTTKSGQEIVGLAAVQGDTVTVLLSDATKVTLRKDDIDSQVDSLISVMPERLLDNLTMQEIADLFAFMEAEPK
jgi:putative heme-binding domain-containing protein